jgi:hypothetical protein
MGAFNQSLIDSGVFVDAGGLNKSALGARVAFDGESRTGIPGPFAQVSELASGSWVCNVKDFDDAIARVKRCPNPMPGLYEIEIRPLCEGEDFI